MSRFSEYGLTPQQEAFAVAVSSGLSLSDAYRKAYPRSVNWKQETVHEKASRLASNAKVSARIAQLRAAVEKASVIEAARVLGEVARLALSDIGMVWNEKENRIKLPNELDPETRAAVASFEMDKDGMIKYRFWDKNAAIEKIMKHLGLYEKNNDQKNDPYKELLASLSGRVFMPREDNGHRVVGTFDHEDGDDRQ
jgi:phage terminase small subunit